MSDIPSWEAIPVIAPKHCYICGKGVLPRAPYKTRMPMPHQVCRPCSVLVRPRYCRDAQTPEQIKAMILKDRPNMLRHAIHNGPRKYYARLWDYGPNMEILEDR